MPEPPKPELFPPETAPPDAIGIDARCLLRTRDGQRSVLVAGCRSRTTRSATRWLAYAMVQLVAQGWAARNKVAQASGRSERSVRRYQRRFEGGGPAASGPLS